MKLLELEKEIRQVMEQLSLEQVHWAAARDSHISYMTSLQEELDNLISLYQALLKEYEGDEAYHGSGL